jgi:hypothetical protein
MSGEADPQYWRERAEEARARADQMNDPRTKRRLLGLADFYERLAGRLERGIPKRRFAARKRA